jgi:2,4-dienoyl-CoA reductase (NADPH2)
MPDPPRARPAPTLPWESLDERGPSGAALGARIVITGARFPLLASPVDLGRLSLRNRVVCLPHGLFYANRMTLRPTARHVGYYAARAAGGAALICCESSVASTDGLMGGPLVLSGDPGCVPGYQAIADAVHAHGARVAGQITHYGAEAATRVTKRPALGPSSLPTPAQQQLPRPMTRADMDRVLDDFVAAAHNFAAAAFDAVEIKIAHDGLLRQFLSPLTNDRHDEYGASAQARVRYPLEIAAAIRAALPEAVALGVRFVADEYVPGGYDLEAGLAYGRMLDESGLFDYISSDVGIVASLDTVIPSMGLPEAHYSEAAFTRLSKSCLTPVIAAGLIRTPAFAERVLAEGKAAAVGLARPMLADPDWAVKAFTGRAAEIRPCTNCNDRCVHNSMLGVPTACTVNPLAGGAERLPAASASKSRVLVVGGGPAGLEAARVAASLGHVARLVEAREELGGQLRLAAAAGDRTGWGDWLAWITRELDRVGVDVSLGHTIAADELKDAQHVVIATGSVPGPVQPAGPDTISVDDFLGSPRTAARIVVIDAGFAGAPFWTTALEAAARGAEVVAVTPAEVPCGEFDLSTLLHLRRRLLDAGVTVLAGHALAGPGSPTHVTVAERASGRAREIAADLVVESGHRQPIDLSPAVQRLDGVTVVGDAVAPRSVADAIRDGNEAITAFTAALE